MLSSTNCAILAASYVSRSAGHFPSSAIVEGKRQFRFSILRVAADCIHCTRGKRRPALSPCQYFLAFTASLGHTSMHVEAVNSPLLRLDTCPSLQGRSEQRPHVGIPLAMFHSDTSVGLPPLLVAGSVALDSSLLTHSNLLAT